MILVISRSDKEGKIFAEIFHYMGIPSVVRRPHEALAEISPIYSAALIPRPDALPDIGEYVHKYHMFNLDVPLFALSGEIKNCAYIPYFDGVYPENITSSRFVREISQICRDRGLHCPGEYRLAGIDASVTKPDVTYFGIPIHLTKTEVMILRYLMRAYPVPASPKSILTHAFRPSRRPELSNVRTHISVINKKFSSLVGRFLISQTPERDGYRIYATEIEILQPTTPLT